ncbi:MAG: uridine phosphorylase [Solobacterium sp.]|nr:uridine phosphorylase [Solobacterium sp.]
MSTVYSPNEEFHLKIKGGEVGKYVILCGDPGRCESIASHFDEPVFVKSNREYTIYNGKLDGEPVTVCSTGIGGPSTAICVEELVHCGSHTFIRMGTSGGMAPEVMGGDVVIGTGAIRMEGTTREYAPIEFPAVANYEVVNALIEAAEASDCKDHYHVGVLQCKDSFYGQHNPASMPVSYELEQKWDAWVKCGALASEMESACLFILGAVRKVRTGSIMTVFANQTRRKLGLEDPQEYSTEPGIRIAVQALRNLIRKDREKEANNPRE